MSGTLREDLSTFYVVSYIEWETKSSVKIKILRRVRVKSRKAFISFTVFVRPSVSQHVSVRLPLNEIA